MNARPKRFTFAIRLLCCLGLAAFASAAVASHSWGNYHWARTANPFTLELGDNVASAWNSSLGTASTDWYSAVLDTTVVTGGTSPRRCRPTRGRDEVCSAPYGNNGWLGLAQIWVSGSHITQAVVKVNDTYFDTPTYDTLEWRNLVMCQEIGHTFGLDHQDENFNNAPLGTCMDYTTDPDPNQHPNAHDYDELETIYAHLDGTTTVGPFAKTGNGKGKGNKAGPPPAMDLIDFETPAQWGMLVSSKHKGKVEVYELDFGGGHKVFTFVIWADENH